MLESIYPYLSLKYTPVAFFVFFTASLYFRRWQTRRSALALGELAPDVGAKGILGWITDTFSQY